MRSTYNQNVSPAPISPNSIGFDWRKNGAGKIAHQLEPLLCSNHQRVEIAAVPFRDRAIWLNEMRFLQIQKHAAVVTLDNFVTPTFRLRFVTNVTAKSR